MRRIDQLVALYKSGAFKHELCDEDDYIRSPKKSGYRGFHLIYRFHSDRTETYNGLKIEMQFRSPLRFLIPRRQGQSSFTNCAGMLYCWTLRRA